jgi:hypothetical protein
MLNLYYNNRIVNSFQLLFSPVRFTMPSIESLCRMFTGRLHWWIGQIRVSGTSPKEEAWIEKLAIFYALEDCQLLFRKDASQQDNQDNLYCRFTMGESKVATKKQLHRFLKDARAEHLKEKMGKTALSQINEFLVDFSLSRHRLEDADTTNPKFRSDEKFEFLLIAESESGTQEQVLRDLLKLTCVHSRFKIMVFKALDEGPQREEQFGRIHQLLKTARRDEDVDWAFIGVPNYHQWISEYDQPESLKRYIWIYNRGSDSLDQASGLWHWSEQQTDC